MILVFHNYFFVFHIVHGGGFEPPKSCDTCFTDRYICPLCHPCFKPQKTRPFRDELVYSRYHPNCQELKNRLEAIYLTSRTLHPFDKLRTTCLIAVTGDPVFNFVESALEGNSVGWYERLAPVVFSLLSPSFPTSLLRCVY